MVRLDQDRNYPEFPIYHFINENCVDSNPVAGCMRAQPVLVLVLVLSGALPALAASTPGSLVRLETGVNTHTHWSCGAVRETL